MVEFGAKGVHQKLVNGNLDPIAIDQLLLHILADRLWGAVNEGPVGANVFQEIAVAATYDLGMMTGHEFIRIRQQIFPERH